jgi:ATP-dependent DNA helicase RecG
MNRIDLIELSKRESERVEWKENVADIEDVIRTAVAFANDYSNLGGGYIVCGAKESKDEHGFQKLIQIGLTSSRLKEIEGKVLSDLREKTFPSIVPLTDEIPITGEKRILIFIIPATDEAHSYRATGKDSSTYYVRIGRETREARNGILRELLVKKNKLAYWDKRINSNATIDDIDLISLREYLKEMLLWDNNKALEDYLSATESLSSFVPPLSGKEKLSDILRPRNFTLLLFSKDPLKYFSGAYTVVSIYKGIDRSEPSAERHQLTGSIIEQARKAIQILNTESYTAFDKNDNIPNQLKYPIRALQEAVINAIVHRDYEIEEPARITVFSDRIEIHSPGSLPRAIDKDKFIMGKANPFWRNQALAYFFNKLQLAQAEGQGIPTIIRTMKEEGCPSPKFDIDIESVTCILPANPRHILIKSRNEIANDIKTPTTKEAKEMHKWSNMIRFFIFKMKEMTNMKKGIDDMTIKAIKSIRVPTVTVIAFSNENKEKIKVLCDQYEKTWKDLQGLNLEITGTNLKGLTDRITMDRLGNVV